LRLATVSDLHLGHAPPFDRFEGGEERLLRYLDRLERTHDVIVLLGDVFQTDYGWRPGSRADVLDAALERYPRAVRRWRAPPYRLVYGNHDAVTRERLGALEELRLEVDGWRAWLIHGHQFDPFIRDESYSVTWSIGLMRRLGLERVPDFLEGPLYEAMQRAARPIGAQDLAARRALLANRCDVVVMGHSHRAVCEPSGRGVYANSGTSGARRFGYVSIDGATRRVETRALLPDGGEWCLAAWTPQGRG
jgi:predicted phosphodiesterase